MRCPAMYINMFNFVFVFVFVLFSPKQNFQEQSWSSKDADTFAPDFGISQSLIIRFSNSLQHCDGDFISLHVICESIFSVEYFLLPPQR